MRLTGETVVGAGLGSSVALSGGTALVGAPRDDIAAWVDAGSVYVFRAKRGGMGSGRPRSRPQMRQRMADFPGSSVALSGDTELIRGYVFVRVGDTWSHQAKLISTTSASVALSGETALIGAYVFVRDGDTWSQQALLTLTGGVSMGGWVALSGDTALIGEYVFVRGGTTWSQQAKLTAGDGAADDEFGSRWRWRATPRWSGRLGDDTRRRHGG